MAMKPFLVTILFCYLSAATAEETTLTLVSSWNRQQNFTALFMKYVDSVNAAGRGVVQIQFLGGPEVIPQRQLFYALRRGVIDMAFGGITYYRGVLPEGDAIFASTITPMQARKNGALDALQPYWEKRVNAHLIGWVQSGVGVVVLLSLEMSLTTPPFGLLLFMMLGVAPKGTTLPDVAMAAIPYLLCDALLVIALIFVPAIALYLPGFL